MKTGHELMALQIKAVAAKVGPTSQPIYWAFVNGVMLRDKTGVGRRFKSEKAALNAARKSTRGV